MNKKKLRAALDTISDIINAPMTIDDKLDRIKSVVAENILMIYNKGILIERTSKDALINDLSMIGNYIVMSKNPYKKVSEIIYIYKNRE